MSILEDNDKINNKDELRKEYHDNHQIYGEVEMCNCCTFLFRIFLFLPKN